MRANLSTLLKTAAKTDDEVVASSWRAQRHATRPQIITVWHYKTAMFQYDMVQGNVIPLNEGWGSMSDKHGVRKVLAGVGIHRSYADLYGK
jgi:hypothetical protein